MTIIISNDVVSYGNGQNYIVNACVKNGSWIGSFELYTEMKINRHLIAYGPAFLFGS